MRTEILLLILVMGAVTFFTRFGSLALLRYTGTPAWLERWLKHVPTGILTALIVPSLLLPHQQLDISLHNNYLLAGLLAAVIAYKTRNAILTMGLGMSAMLVLRWAGI